MMKDGKIDEKIFPDHAAALRSLHRKSVERSPDQKVLMKIKRNFGLTNNYNVAGYILADGSMLNLSGQNRGAGAGDVRGVDHRAVGHFLDREDYDAIREFGNRFGAISLHYGQDYANMRIYKSPTKQQMARLAEIRRLVTHMQLNLHGERGQDADKMYGKQDFSYVTDIKRFYGI